MAFLDNFLNKRKNTSKNPSDEKVDTSFIDAHLEDEPMSSISYVLANVKGDGSNLLERKLGSRKFREKITNIMNQKFYSL